MQKRGPGFYFLEVSANDIFKEIKKLKTRKATQNIDIPVKILRENADIFSVYICEFCDIYKERQVSFNFKKC